MLPGNADQLALVDVLGVSRPINLGMLEVQPVAPGEWLMIHMGFALERIDEEGAIKAMAGLELMGRSADDDACDAAAGPLPRTGELSGA